MFHTFTGCDQTSFFLKSGKRTAWKTSEVLKYVVDVFDAISRVPPSLKKMYKKLSGGELNIATKGRGQKDRDPAIPQEWADAMVSLVNAHDSDGNPVFNPTLVNEKEPKKAQHKLSFTPPSKKRSAASANLDVAQAHKKKKEKKEKKKKKNMKKDGK